MAFTQADLDKVNKAIATGELSIGLGDMRITYRNMDELIAARNTIVADLRAQASASRGTRFTVADFSQ